MSVFVFSLTPIYYFLRYYYYLFADVNCFLFFVFFAGFLLIWNCINLNQYLFSLEYYYNELNLSFNKKVLYNYINDVFALMSDVGFSVDNLFILVFTKYSNIVINEILLSLRILLLSKNQ